MIVPGANLLNEAFACIGTSTVQYQQSLSRALNTVGQWVSTYANPVPIQCSVQAVPRNKYVQLGLDLNKEYVSVFVPRHWKIFERDLTGDQFIFDKQLFRIENDSDWFVQDYWVSITAVKVK